MKELDFTLESGEDIEFSLSSEPSLGFDLSESPVEIGGGEIKRISWHQCPQAVRDFIDEVIYDPSDYSYSEVEDYAPDPAVQSNTKPVAETVTGDGHRNEVPNVETPFANATKAGTLEPLDQVRWINSVTSNFRDLGGWDCDGGTVKYGILYRSAELNAADADLVRNTLGIKTELDLTADGTHGAISGLRYVGADSYAMYALTPVSAWKTNLRAVFDAAKYNEPLIFHCSMGADRTGTLACIIEGILGVSQSDCDKDYELTSFYSERKRNGSYQDNPNQTWAKLMESIGALSGSTFRDKCVNFAASLGFTAAEINAFRAAMTDGDPETVTPDIDTFTVTKTLTHVTSDNNAATVPEYQPYEANITPNSGYAISSVSIKMGGADITDQVWSGKETSLYRTVRQSLIHCTADNDAVRVIAGQSFAANISADTGYTLDGATVSITMGGVEVSTQYYSEGKIAIPSVTGNIVIEIEAVQSAQENLFDKSDTNVEHGARIKSTGETEAYADGQLVTGFIPAAVGDVVQLTTDKDNKSNSYTGMIAFYDADKTYLQVQMIWENSLWSWSDSNRKGSITVPSEYDGKYLSETAYMRLCCAYTDEDSIVITKE